jgi:hypothetical protein
MRWRSWDEVAFETALEAVVNGLSRSEAEPASGCSFSRRF